MELGQHDSSFLKLPKELRLMIYEPFLRNSVIRVGIDQINGKHLTKWPQQPGICRTCRLFRSETIETYYSLANVQLNIQRPSGESMVLHWISTIAGSMPSAFNNIRHVSIIAGLGYNDPPKEYRVDMQQCALIAALRPCIAAYLYNYRGHIRLWSQLVSGALKRRLKRMPDQHQPGFSVAQNLREVLATVGELCGYGLDEAGAALPATTLQRSTPQKESPLLALPKELRLAIYEYVFSTNTEVIIGERDLRNQLLTDGPPSPGLLRAASIIRSEALPVYFARTHFVLNVQRILCEEAVSEWIQRCLAAFPHSLRRLNFVSVIAGSGIRQPPHQYEFRLQKNRVLSVVNRPTFLPYTLSDDRWYPPILEAVQEKLEQMPKKGQRGFDVVANIREIIDILAN